jgi:hypothetical protein
MSYVYAVAQLISSHMSGGSRLSYHWLHASRLPAFGARLDPGADDNCVGVRDTWRTAPTISTQTNLTNRSRNVSAGQQYMVLPQGDNKFIIILAKIEIDKPNPFSFFQNQIRVVVVNQTLYNVGYYQDAPPLELSIPPHYRR